MRRKKIEFKQGDVFAIPLENKKYALGQVLDQAMINSVRIALYDETADVPDMNLINQYCDLKNLISLIEVTKEQIVYGVWKIIGNKEVSIPVSKYPNEQFRIKKWVGSLIRDAALAEDFLNTFYGLIPWDDWYDPDYLDKYLVDIKKKPDNLILIKK